MHGPKLSVLLYIAGLTLLVVGAVLGFVPVSAGGQSCGSAFNAPDGQYGLGDSCDALRTTARPWAVAALILGAGVFVMGMYASGEEDVATRAAIAAQTAANRPDVEGDDQV